MPSPSPPASFGRQSPSRPLAARLCKLSTGNLPCASTSAAFGEATSEAIFAAASTRSRAAGESPYTSVMLLLLNQNCPKVKQRRLMSQAAVLDSNLDHQQAIEEGPISLQRDSQILSSDVPASVPIAFEALSLSGKDLRQPLHGFRHQFIRLLHCLPRFIDKLSLDGNPA